jgi:hypothetical protein
MNLEHSFEAALWSGLMSDEVEDASLDPLAEQTRRGLELVKPRDVASNPRCPDCRSLDRNPQMPPMMHIAHPCGPCQMRDIGAVDVCGCTSERQI